VRIHFHLSKSWLILPNERERERESESEKKENSIYLNGKSYGSVKIFLNTQER
jgi:hypothetical protein